MGERARVHYAPYISVWECGLSTFLRFSFYPCLPSCPSLANGDDDEPSGSKFSDGALAGLAAGMCCLVSIFCRWNREDSEPNPAIDSDSSIELKVGSDHFNSSGGSQETAASADNGDDDNAHLYT